MNLAKSFYEIRTVEFELNLIKEIILDVKNYPKFLPWCKSSSIIAHHDNFFLADLEIAFKGLNTSYRSKITPAISDSKIYTIHIESTQGPLQYLHNIWKLKQMNHFTQIQFFINFEFKSTTLNMIASMGLFIVKSKILNAFIERAKLIAELHQLNV
ncbi:type II toxin-antitoxin system RatA family toxin [Rickettsia endosymbiont of Cardiosporidium cionae]|uniref:type II toxin-antitoxin system RatA family toxin n=1 Tax=Rickettsia endosymbiont of Cardiosporidium cionae TaxID=2777155 RepID=UPI0018933D74|nr:type II toxin-antitoxin system RatA family toxin [Rickettsia endosymbiont of Cardiosporidium cionae]KAF8818263.1 ubiquinone-binding protein [Rickettsia endosymbiont of Cardiosporidium cionae]